MQYLKYLLKHKWFVFKAGLYFKAPLWNLIIHDLTKFLPSEFIPYSRYFYKPKIRQMGFTQSIIDQFEAHLKDFNKAWLYHQNRNPHHWQYWILINDDKYDNDLEKLAPIEMPEKYVREMLADWVGAGKAIGNDDIKNWYKINELKIILHPKTRILVNRLLEEYYADH